MFKVTVINSDDWEMGYRRLMSDDHYGLRSSLAALMEHKVTGAIMGLMYALGFIGCAWTLLVPV